MADRALNAHRQLAAQLRHELVLDLVAQGLTMAEAGSRLGISGARVQQLVAVERRRRLLAELREQGLPPAQVAAAVAERLPARISRRRPGRRA